MMDAYVYPGLLSKLVLSEHDILEKVLPLLGADIEELKNGGRLAKYVHNRRIIFCLLRKFSNMSLAKIGEIFGLSHSDVLYHLIEAEQRASTLNKVREIESILKGNVVGDMPNLNLELPAVHNGKISSDEIKLSGIINTQKPKK